MESTDAVKVKLEQELKSSWIALLLRHSPLCIGAMGPLTAKAFCYGKTYTAANILSITFWRLYKIPK